MHCRLGGYSGLGLYLMPGSQSRSPSITVRCQFVPQIPQVPCNTCTAKGSVIHPSIKHSK